MFNFLGKSLPRSRTSQKLIVINILREKKDLDIQLDFTMKPITGNTSPVCRFPFRSVPY